jgi:hypothetical protein
MEFLLFLLLNSNLSIYMYFIYTCVFQHVVKEHMESTAPRIVLRTVMTCVTMLTDPARVYLDGKGPLTVMKVCINYSLANK